MKFTGLISRWTMAAILALCLVGCSGTQRTDTIKATVVALDAAHAALPVYAHQHTEDLISKSHSDAEMRASVDSWRALVDKANNDIANGYRLAAAAALANNDASVATLTAAAKALHDELVSLGVMTK